MGVMEMSSRRLWVAVVRADRRAGGRTDSRRRPPFLSSWFVGVSPLPDVNANFDKTNALTGARFNSTSPCR